jgi:hypothetical protein
VVCGIAGEDDLDAPDLTWRIESNQLARQQMQELVLLQLHQLIVRFLSQYPADLRIFRKEFRIVADYAADLCRSPDVLYNMLLEPLFFVDREFFYFGVSKYSDGKPHGISPLKSCW